MTEKKCIRKPISGIYILSILLLLILPHTYASLYKGDYDRTISNITLKGNSIVGTEKKKNKTVGLFYFVWLGQHGTTGIYDNSKIDHAALFSTAPNDLTPMNQYHFWGQPLYGYYNSEDPWVMTRHIELLTMAGIDYLIIDTTNAFYYPSVMHSLIQKLLFFQKQGWSVPKVAFYTNSSSGTTVTNIYNEYYKSEKYNDIWFRMNEKPLIIGITANNNNTSDQTFFNGAKDFISPQLVEYFDVRESQWPNVPIHEESFPWISWDYPQKNHKGTVSVSVAQHPEKSVFFSDTTNTKGRGYDAITKKNNTHLSRDGKNFQDQWETVFSLGDAVSNVFVTGWNEWVAIKLASEKGKVFFVDAYNEEFSRDSEMMKGGYNDNFYLQLVRNIKKFKYENTPSIANTFRQPSHYKDFSGDAINRDYKDFSGKGRYIDSSARNDITDIIVEHDKKNIYFTIKTAEAITSPNPSEENWMNIFIKTHDAADNFEGFNYVVNRTFAKNKTANVEKSSGGYKWKNSGHAKYELKGNVLKVSIPLKSLSISADTPSIEFKVADHVTNYEDIMDYYVSGDVAPIGRLTFQYSFKGS